MTRKELDLIRERMYNHGTGPHPVYGTPTDCAIVVLTARELQELLDLAEEGLKNK